MKKIPSIENLNPALSAVSSASTSFSEILNAWSDYKKTYEIERTKREFISAKRDVCIAQIRAQQETIKHYLTERFSERKLVILGMFDTLDKGIEKGDDKLISQAMDNIINTVKTSPLDGIKNLISQIDDQNVDAIDI